MAPMSEMVTARPAPLLAGFIDRYIGYRVSGFAPGLHRGLPSRHMTFIVAIEHTIDLIGPAGYSPDHYRCVLSGLQSGPALIEHNGYQQGVAIELTPLGSRALFGVPAGALWDTLVELEDVTGAVGRQLGEQLHELTTWPERFAACDMVLSQLADPEHLVAPELTWVWRAVTGTDQVPSVAALAERVGWSRQHLTRRFAAEFGSNPKLVSRIDRFERAKTMLERSPSFDTIAQVAATCGYYDQSHLNRDFTDLAGCSPTSWLAGEIPSVQYLDNVDK